MEGIFYIPLFVICILISLAVSLILYNYQDTISPINQNIIQKLSTFCVLLMTPGVCIQVKIQKMLWESIQLVNEFQGVSVILKAAVGSLNYEAALVLRTFLFFTVFLIFITGNVICVLRLVTVLQVRFLFKLELKQCWWINDE